uniref:ShKT domain-containing protein n=1 Tax=Romanomermis culicivorax TaxID=13658 RepID=A0A915KNY9_ROMCU
MIILKILILLLPYASSSPACQSGCCDLHDFCPFWAATNECFRNPDWMAANCLFSCNTCGLTNSASGSPPGSSPTADFISPPDQPRSAIDPAPAAVHESAPVAAVVPEEQQTTETTTTTTTTKVTTRKAPPDPACSTESTSSRRIITSLDLANSKSSSNCVPQQNAGSSCDPNSCFNKRYRSADGFCNNPSNAILGASATPFRRLRAAHADDGSSPSTRRPNARFNGLVMQFGQFLTHDVSKNSLLPVTKCGGFGCGPPNEICFPIPVNGTDPIFGCQADHCCLPFARAAPICGDVNILLLCILNPMTARIDEMLFAVEHRKIGYIPYAMPGYARHCTLPYAWLS